RADERGGAGGVEIARGDAPPPGSAVELGEGEAAGLGGEDAGDAGLRGGGGGRIARADEAVGGRDAVDLRGAGAEHPGRGEGGEGGQADPEQRGEPGALVGSHATEDEVVAGADEEREHGHRAGDGDEKGVAGHRDVGQRGERGDERVGAGVRVQVSPPPLPRGPARAGADPIGGGGGERVVPDGGAGACGQDVGGVLRIQTEDDHPAQAQRAFGQRGGGGIVAVGPAEGPALAGGGGGERDGTAAEALGRGGERLAGGSVFRSVENVLGGGFAAGALAGGGRGGGGVESGLDLGGEGAVPNGSEGDEIALRAGGEPGAPGEAGGVGDDDEA